MEIIGKAKNQSPTDYPKFNRGAKMDKKNIKENHPLPFPCAYWVEPGKLLAGEYPGAKKPGEATRKLRGLLDCGIRQVVNLMEPHEVDYQGDRFTPYEERLKELARERGHAITCIRRPIPDMSVPTPSAMIAILDVIDGAMAENRPLYVHCLAGLGRTGAVVGCHLMRRGLVKKETVIQHIAHLRRHTPNAHMPSPEITPQRDMVLQFKS